MSTSRTVIINAAGIGSRLGMNIPKTLISIHGKPVIFLHPKQFLGTLIELEEV